MKYHTLRFAFLFLCIFSKACFSQITLEHTVDSTLYGYYFYPTKISANETKYVFLDTATNTFSLFNLDFTPFLTNIIVPSPIKDTVNGFTVFYHIMYITRTLFDCDSTNIEYLYSAQNDPWLPLWVQRTDGTTLLHVDSTRGPYCLGCPGGTTLLRPILTTEQGTKLVLMKNPGVGVTNISVYSLCGSLPSNEYEIVDQKNGTVEVFPNPSASKVYFNINYPDNINTYSLTVLNNSSGIVSRLSLKSSIKTYSIDTFTYSNGIYYYSLMDEKTNTIIDTGSFIISK
jgi:hypothetical protein